MLIIADLTGIYEPVVVEPGKASRAIAHWFPSSPFSTDALQRLQYALDLGEHTADVELELQIQIRPAG